MAKPKSTSDNSEFVLKHRVVGAGVLIVFGTIVLPWLLGPPSHATKDESLTTEIVEDVTPERSTFESVDPSIEEPEETVYISKITPLDELPEDSANNGNPSKAATKDSENRKSETSEANSPDKSQAKKNSNVAKNQAKDQENKAVDPKPEKVEPKPQVSKKEETTKPVVKKSEKPAEKVSVAQPKVDVGWVVQVDLFLEKEGANRKVAELRSKGFEPSTTIVDTNKGKRTGTRVWIGPYRQRADAAKANEQLEKQLGKRGFLRVYP